MDADDFVARADFALAQDAEIETAAAAGEESLGHVVALEFQIQLVAGNSRLRDDDFGAANRVSVSEGDIVFEEALRREIFSEGAPRQVHTRQFILPISVVLGGIGVHCFIPAAVDCQVCLAVAIKIVRAHEDALVHGVFENASRYFAAVEQDSAGNSDLNGNQLGAHGLPLVARDAEALAALQTFDSSAKEQMQMIFVLGIRVQSGTKIFFCGMSASALRNVAVWLYCSVAG